MKDLIKELEKLHDKYEAEWGYDSVEFRGDLIKLIEKHWPDDQAEKIAELEKENRRISKGLLRYMWWRDQ